jgi:hypothetical protein
MLVVFSSLPVDEKTQLKTSGYFPEETQEGSMTSGKKLQPSGFSSYTLLMCWPDNCFVMGEGGCPIPYNA